MKLKLKRTFHFQSQITEAVYIRGRKWMWAIPFLQMGEQVQALGQQSLMLKGKPDSNSLQVRKEMESGFGESPNPHF